MNNLNTNVYHNHLTTFLSTMNQTILICETCNQPIQRNSYLYKSFDSTYCSMRCRTTSIQIIQQVDPNYDNPRQWKLILSKYLRSIHVSPPIDDTYDQDQTYTDIYINYSTPKAINKNNNLRKNQSMNNLIIKDETDAINENNVIINVTTSPIFRCSSLKCTKNWTTSVVMTLGVSFLVGMVYFVFSALK